MSWRSGRGLFAGGSKSPRAGRIFLALHHKVHLEILRGSIRLVEKAGYPVQLVAIDPRAVEALDAIGRTSIDVASMEAGARPGDVVVVACDWWPASYVDAIDRMRSAGVKVIGVVEAPRFSLPDRYCRVDEMLVWSAAARGDFQVPVHVVGSPVLERCLARRRPARAHGPILVNYKKASPGDGPDDSSWLERVSQACRGNGRIVLSAHPAAFVLPPGAVPSDKPVARLLRRARLLISRPSTIVHQALAIGTPVILGEALCEFADPMGSYQIASSPEELGALVAEARRGALPEASTAFLDHHLSVDPERRPAQRMADAIVAVLLRNQRSDGPAA